MLARLAMIFLLAMLPACASTPSGFDEASPQQQVADTERAFAASMASRDFFAAFTSFLSADAIFFGAEVPLRGKQEVADFWQRYYQGPDAPFSWQPETVEVLDSGDLALSSGPVFDADGKLVATFTSIWRLEESGHWKIVFDKGNPVVAD